MNNHPLLNIVQNIKKLTEIADTYDTPCYIYSSERVQSNAMRLNDVLKKYFHKYHICYAIKANSNPHLMKIMKKTLPLIGGDCSSPGEIYAVKKAEIDPANCIYTGNYESITDLSLAIEEGCYLNLDDETSFDRLAQENLPTRISFRLNPGFGKGTFSQITTAGENAKFGIPVEKIIGAYRKAKNAGIQKFGIQCMTGSGVLTESYFPKLLTAILKTTNKIEEELKIQFDFISMGGGLGIPYSDDEKELNLDTVFFELSKVFYNQYNKNDSAPALWLEPGKYLIGDAAFILTKVIGLKDSYKNFIGLDAGMETLMRPALYGATHRIYKVGFHGDPIGTFDFTGPICENTDRIAENRAFPATKEGDLIAVMDTGAYGFAMSHNFNTRPRAAEILLEETSHRLIRRRETIEDIFSNCHV